MQAGAPREFAGWHIYFPSEQYKQDDARNEFIREFISIFRSADSPSVIKSHVIQRFILHVDYRSFFSENTKHTFVEQPDYILKCMGVALHEVLFRGSEMDLPYQDQSVVIRILNYGPETAMKRLKANIIGKFVTVRGTVVRVSPIRPLGVQMDFVCNKCGCRVPQPFENGRYAVPVRCINPECRGRVFHPDRSSMQTVDWQKIRVQEIITDYSDSGRVPRTIECELSRELVDTCVPGDVVTISGQVCVASVDADGGGRRGKKDKVMFLLYIFANNIRTARNQDVDILQFSNKDLQAIQRVSQEPNLFSLLVNSLCPAIFGHTMVKAGFVLALFGGTAHPPRPGQLPVRSDVHALVVGDPGMGKSQMLRAVASAAPRGVYVCGNTTTSSGLTVTVIKEGGDFALEAGALVLGDQGSCCIDEFDKMGNEHQALLEAMEQQSISIAKGGMVCSLCARTSVLAAANPSGGHYNRAKTVSENLKISPMILSRFDLVFILMDKPDEEKDILLSDYLMDLHSGTHKSKAFCLATPPSASASSLARPDTPLQMRLSSPCADPLPHQLFRRYLSYARAYCLPRLSAEARDMLKAFYLSLRRSHHRQDSVPITTRQLESLARLAEARAKAELREEVTADDAADVIAIMKESLFESLSDEYGQVDFSRISGVSKTKELQCVARALHHKSQRTGQATFTVEDITEIAREIGVRSAIEPLIDRLNTHNYLLKKGPRVYRLLTSAAEI